MKKPFKLLVIEDDYTLGSMYEERFGKEGYKVDWIDNGEDGITEALANVPDLVVLDLMLPKKGGLAVLQVLRTRPETRDVPVVIITNHPDDKYREAAERFGIDDFIFKAQIMPKEVVEKIGAIIKKHYSDHE